MKLLTILFAFFALTAQAQQVQLTADTTTRPARATRKIVSTLPNGVTYQKGITGNAEVASTRMFRTLSELRSFTQPATGVQYYLSEKGREGYWYYDPADNSTTDNSGTVVVATGGKRLKRAGSTVSLDFFGAKADNATNAAPAFALAQEMNDFVEMKDGTYRVNGSVTLPQKFDGKKAFINATGVVRISNKTYQNITVNARHLVVSGTRLSTINYTADTLDIDGFQDDYGCAWNRFINIGSNKTLIRISTNKGYVNFNTFDGGRVKVEITGSTAYEAHQNLFINADFTYAQGNGGYKQNAQNRQSNLIINGYAEANSRIEGQLGIVGLNYDSDQPPLIDSRGFVLGATENIARTAGDFLPIGRNITFGDWSNLNEQGYPVDFINLSGPVSVVNDNSEISGLKKAIRITTTNDFQGFQIIIPPVYTHADREIQSVNLTLYYKGDDFQVGEAFKLSGNSIYFGVKPSRADTLTGWKLLRVIVPASRTETTYARFILPAGKTTYVSTYHATPAKIAVLPTPAFASVLQNGVLQVYDKRSLRGQVVQQYTTQASVAYTVNFSAPLVEPIVNITLQPYDATYNAIEVQASHPILILNSQGQATGFRFTATSQSADWSGRFLWKATEY